jgi:signal transduction histidine kinase/phage shock protein PspC (stress-responsive transcriptional regulator)
MTRPRRVVIGGVCAGLAEHLSWPLWRVRALAVLLTLCGGAGLLLYLWLWALTPLVDGDQGVRRLMPGAAILLGGGLIATGVVVSVPQHSVGSALVPGALEMVALLSAAVAWSLAFDRPDPSRSAAYGVWIRSISAGLLAATGALLLLRDPRGFTAVAAIVMIVLGIGVLVAPSIVRLWSDLMGERAGRVREEQRAEIAAHLHDSVLQTLALIQNRAGASSEVARIARAQERELRDWLFVGSAAVTDDLALELREAAAAIELEYPARLEVVAAGESIERPSAALVAAAREGMLNAARHAGGEVSVYLESSPTAVDVFIRDRGPGVDITALPNDRLGIRESIIGRMTRAGGTATVRPGAGGIGTEVHLHLETAHD